MPAIYCCARISYNPQCNPLAETCQPSSSSVIAFQSHHLIHPDIRHAAGLARHEHLAGQLRLDMLQMKVHVHHAMRSLFPLIVHEGL